MCIYIYISCLTFISKLNPGYFIIYLHTYTYITKCILYILTKNFRVLNLCYILHYTTIPSVYYVHTL